MRYAVPNQPFQVVCAKVVNGQYGSVYHQIGEVYASCFTEAEADAWCNYLNGLDYAHNAWIVKKTSLSKWVFTDENGATYTSKGEYEKGSMALYNEEELCAAIPAGKVTYKRAE